MLIGLMSDTHGDVGRTARALTLFMKAGVKYVLHAGDVGSQSVLDEFSALDVPFAAVRGNVDFDLKLPPFKEFTLAGRRIALVHGDDPQRLESAISRKVFDYVITGHTHAQRDETFGETRVINPGAVYRANPPSVALLNLETGDLKFVKL